MAKSSAMVQAKVVKGGGAGAKKELDCAKIFQCFDPPIEFGSHEDNQGTVKNHQSEHVPPCSAFHRKGRGGTRMPDCTGYTTEAAPTWMVRDRQKPLQEHKILTDQMRKFSQKNSLKGEQASLKDWMKEYRKGAEKALKEGKPKRKITSDEHDENSLIEAAAECIEKEMMKAFAEMEPPVKPDTKLRNPWKATKEQKAEAAEAIKKARTRK
jgi:hypothetical protein